MTEKQWEVFWSRVVNVEYHHMLHNLVKAAFTAGVVAATLESGVKYDRNSFDGMVKEVDEFFKKAGES